MGKKANRNVEGVVQQLVEIEGIPREQAEALTNEVYKRDDIDLNKVSSDPENIIEGLMEFMRQNHPIRKTTLRKNWKKTGKR